jgi:hypothetical protein
MIFKKRQMGIKTLERFRTYFPSIATAYTEEDSTQPEVALGHLLVQNASMSKRRVLVATTHAYKCMDRDTAPLRLWTRSLL